MKAVIMAGGYAKRMWPLTKEIAKPLLPVAGKPIIDYIWEQLKPLDVDKVYISTNALFAPQFQRWVDEKADERLVLAVEEARSEEQKLGSLGALWQIIGKKAIDDDMMVLAGDNLVSIDLAEFRAAYDGRPLVALYDMGDPAKLANKYGTIEVKNGVVVGFEEKPAQPRSSLASSGFYIYPAKTLRLFSRYLTEGNSMDSPGFFLQWLHRVEEVKAFVFKGTWYDIGDRESYIKANQELFNGNMVLGETNGSKVERSFVGSHSRVRGSSLTNCIVLDSCAVEDCALDGCVVGTGSALRGLREKDKLFGCNAKS